MANGKPWHFAQYARGNTQTTAHTAMPTNQYHAFTEEKNTAIKMMASRSSTVAKCHQERANGAWQRLGEQGKHSQRERDIRSCRNRPTVGHLARM